jgi:hypothetical protein
VKRGESTEEIVAMLACEQRAPRSRSFSVLDTPTAIEQIVSAYVRLRNRGALEELRAHRQRLALQLNKMRPDLNYDASLPLRSLAEDLAAIDAGMEQLDAPADVGPD